MRRRSLLPLFGGFFLLAGAAQVAGMVELPARAAGAEGGLLAGCTDIPEAVDLAALLDLRAQRLERFKAELARQRADIAVAEGTLTLKLRQLKALRDAEGAGRGAMRQAVSDDIDRLVAVYDQMKPAEAAAILSNLPPDFAAEILMRVEPGTGARIIAAVDPGQAAILTTHMGARRVAPAKD